MPTTSQFENEFEYYKLAESWHSIWKLEEKDNEREKKRLKIFFETIDSLLKDNDMKSVSKLLGVFCTFIDRRSTWFLVYPQEVFPKFLELHFLIWSKNPDFLKDNQPLEKEYGLHAQDSYKDTSLIIKKIRERSLTSSQIYPFLSHFKEHIKRRESEFIETKSLEDGMSGKVYYADSLIPIFFDSLIEGAEDPKNRDDIWIGFPESWKITKENIEGQENHIPEILFKEFFCWAKKRISTYTEIKEHDEVLSRVALNLFPEVDPCLWAMFLTFLAGKKTIKSLVEQKIIFGFLPSSEDIHIHEITGISIEQEPQKHNKDIDLKHNTRELALTLFPKDFSKENLGKFIHDLEKLESEYKNGTIEENLRKDFIQIFKQMREILSQNESGKP